LGTDEIVEAVLAACPDMRPLEAHRHARGWSRAEVSARLDGLYDEDGLAPPHLSAADLCRYEHGQRHPSEERLEYLCKLYETRPDRLGYGRDYSPAQTSHLQRAGIVDLFPRTDTSSRADVISRLRAARQRVNVFGLTLSFYGREELLPILRQVAESVPVRLYVMDPYCASRRDRYRLEPAEAAMEDPNRYVREILRPLARLAADVPGLQIYTYNFPCSFSIEEIDAVCRVAPYGHGRRGTEGPIFVFAEGTPYHEYFASQIRWLERLAADPDIEPWASKGIKVSRYAEG
jgi:transcriptional regulator with XRE-family HTH domain